MGPALDQAAFVEDENLVAVADGREPMSDDDTGSAQVSYIPHDQFKIRPGEYVAIVGKTGCGKSTVLRLLLGFEKPESGAIYYDGNNLERLDLCSVRQSIGVVLQTSKLFPGDMFSNIVLTAPWKALDDAWEAARLAGVEEDINCQTAVYKADSRAPAVDRPRM